MKLRELRNRLGHSLAGAGVPRPLWEAELFLEKATGWTRREQLVFPEREVPETHRDTAEALARRRLTGEPLDYVLGEAPFGAWAFAVGPGCLIPRPESEVLVREAVARLPRGGSFLDWGAGSGCLACSVALERPDLRGCALEASPAALRWAWRNLRRHGLQDRVLLWHGRSPTELPPGTAPFHGVLANPPYIPTEHWIALDPSVRDQEPRCALDGGDRGLEPLLAWLALLPPFLEPGGWILAETAGPWQIDLLQEHRPEGLCLEEVLEDPFGVPRFVLWRRTRVGLRIDIVK